jgi:hypothetical protein
LHQMQHDADRNIGDVANSRLEPPTPTPGRNHQEPPSRLYNASR